MCNAIDIYEKPMAGSFTFDFSSDKPVSTLIMAQVTHPHTHKSLTRDHNLENFLYKVCIAALVKACYITLLRAVEWCGCGIPSHFQLNNKVKA